MKTILEEAQELTSGDRHDSYGDIGSEAEAVALGWKIIIDRAGFNKRTYPLCMIWVKLVRESYKSKRDNRVDIAGYVHLLDKIE